MSCHSLYEDHLQTKNGGQIGTKISTSSSTSSSSPSSVKQLCKKKTYKAPTSSNLAQQRDRNNYLPWSQSFGSPVQWLCFTALGSNGTQS